MSCSSRWAGWPGAAPRGVTTRFTREKPDEKRCEVRPAMRVDSEPPRDRRAWIGLVPAAVAGANGALQVPPEFCVLGRDTGQARRDRLLHPLASPIGVRPQHSVATAESGGSGQFVREEVELGPRAARPLDDRTMPRLPRSPPGGPRSGRDTTAGHAHPGRLRRRDRPCRPPGPPPSPHRLRAQPSSSAGISRSGTASSAAMYTKPFAVFHTDVGGHDTERPDLTFSNERVLRGRLRRADSNARRAR